MLGLVLWPGPLLPGAWPAHFVGNERSGSGAERDSLAVATCLDVEPDAFDLEAIDDAARLAGRDGRL